MSRFFNKKAAVVAAPSSSSDDDSDERVSDSGSDAEGGMFATQKSKSTANKTKKAAADSSESDSDADSDSDSESESDSEDDKKKAPAKKTAVLAKFGRKTTRTIAAQQRRQKSPRLNDLRASVAALNTKKKINDWGAIQSEFDKLNTSYSRLSQIVNADAANPQPFRFYFRALAQLEDFHKQTAENKDLVKKMNTLNTKAFTAMKQKIKKQTKSFEDEIKEWRATEIDEEASEAEAIARASAAGAGDAGDESEDSIFGDDSDSESESEDEDKEDLKHLSARERMLKKFGRSPVNSDDEGAAKKKPEVKAVKTKKVVIQDGKEDGAATASAPTEGGFTAVGKGGKAIEVTQENLYKRLQELILARGKKSTDKVQQIEYLTQLLGVCITAHQKVQVLLVLIPSQFDYNPLASGGFLPTEYWKNTRANIDSLLELLETTQTLTVTETLVGDDIDPAINENRFKEGETVNLRGNIYSFIDRLSDEFIKSLQNIDPHTTEYIERLKDETPLYVLIVRAQKYFGRVQGVEAHDACILKRVMHIYYKTENVIAFLESALPAHSRDADMSPNNLVHNLCTTLYQTNDIRIRARALLAHVYHLALHGRFYEARDMLLMSHLQEQAQNTDIDTQILYNRTIVQLGMSAFRSGLIRESANALQDFFGSGKTKELLAQGFQQSNARFGEKSEKTPEQERLEKQRLLPFHMHINLELLECIYLTCSMLLEIPNMAMYAHDSRRKMISKPFRRNLDYNQKQVFIGPPENTRDHIMAAAKSLSAGEWQKCVDYITSIKIWSLMTSAPQIKVMLAQKIQEEGLRTYIFQFAPYYDALGLAQLSSMFDLPVSRVHGIIAKMIVNEELCASLDEPTQTVVLHRNAPGVEMSRLEYLAGVYADKVSTLVDGNEKMLESRSIMLGLQQQQQQLNAGGGGFKGNRGATGGSGMTSGGARVGGDKRPMGLKR
ncbi:eukaryotic translation initiation factor 3 subunit 8 N-terminus-domain-containing protein [Chytriomyces sp. MP71]|nr:eukaryotic translation initiation factor 3 subunit 8 N-terminus-domain-containing protein [Chytriomyces sp. MP71]